MTAPKDGKGNPLEESPEVTRVRQALEESPLNLSRTSLHGIFNPPPEPDRRRILEVIQREADHRRAYEDAVIELARRQVRPDTTLTSPPVTPQRELDKPEQGAAAHGTRTQRGAGNISCGPCPLGIPV